VCITGPRLHTLLSCFPVFLVFLLCFLASCLPTFPVLPVFSPFFFPVFLFSCFPARLHWVPELIEAAWAVTEPYFLQSREDENFNGPAGNFAKP